MFIQNEQVYANSQDVAKFFEKKHFHVLRDIDHLIEQGVDGSASNFGDTPYTNPQNGQTYRTYNMTKDGFALLVMGFTGKKALAFKLQYIEAFNRMEEQIRRQADVIVLPDFTKPFPCGEVAAPAFPPALTYTQTQVGRYGETEPR